SFAGTLAEDLFASGRLRAVVMNGGTPLETRRLRDIEAFLDDLARLQPLGEDGRFTATGPLPDHNLITFAPDGARGVAAYVDGRKTASA
ncbi:MAG: DUF58 domain-containing protein, partial [Oleiharenicola lentus]